MGRMKIPQISVQELDNKIKKNDEFVLIDVREIEEYEFCKIDIPPDPSVVSIPASDPKLDVVNATEGNVDK